MSPLILSVYKIPFWFQILIMVCSNCIPGRHHHCCIDFFRTLCTPHFSSNLFQLLVTCLLYQSPIDFGHSAIPFMANRGPKGVFLCVLWRLEFSTDFLHIHTQHALNQGLDANQFLAPCGFICGHQRAEFVCFLCTYTVNHSVFNWSFSNLHQIFIGPCSRCQYIFPTI